MNEFENELAARLGVKSAAALLRNGAIHMALKAAGVVQEISYSARHYFRYSNLLFM